MLRLARNALLAITALCVRTASADEVDLALVLAVDISYSAGEQDMDLQRRGYVTAFRMPEVIEAILGGPNGRIAVTYMEWGGPGTQNQRLPWTVIDDFQEARAFADRLQTAEMHRSDETSIAAALLRANALFADAPPALRYVIDLSGDGYNNSGGNVSRARDLVAAAGVTINGLAILSPDAPNLDVYFAECVIGGPGGKVFVAAQPKDFTRALQRKLVWEISGLRPERLYRVTATDCQIGERRARDEYMRQLDKLTNGKSERWRPRQQDWPDPD